MRVHIHHVQICSVSKMRALSAGQRRTHGTARSSTRAFRCHRAQTPLPLPLPLPREIRIQSCGVAGTGLCSVRACAGVVLETFVDKFGIEAGACRRSLACPQRYDAFRDSSQKGLNHVTSCSRVATDALVSVGCCVASLVLPVTHALDSDRFRERTRQRAARACISAGALLAPAFAP